MVLLFPAYQLVQLYHSIKSNALYLSTDVSGMSLTRLGKPGENMNLHVPYLYSASEATKTCHTKHARKNKRNPLPWPVYPASVSSQETDY